MGMGVIPSPFTPMTYLSPLLGCNHVNVEHFLTGCLHVNIGVDLLPPGTGSSVQAQDRRQVWASPAEPVSGKEVLTLFHQKLLSAGASSGGSHPERTRSTQASEDAGWWAST